MHACYPTTCVPHGTEEGIRSFGSGGREGCEPPCQCWESSPGPLEDEQSVLLTAGAYPQPQESLLYKVTAIQPPQLTGWTVQAVCELICEYV